VICKYIILSMIFQPGLRLLYQKDKLPSASKSRRIVSVPKQEKQKKVSREHKWYGI